MKSEMSKKIEMLIGFKEKMSVEIVNELIEEIGLDGVSINVGADANLVICYILSLVNDKIKNLKA